MKPLTEIQKKFIELERQKAEHRKFFDELREATKALIEEQGLDVYFQDDEGIVYKTAASEGRFVYNEPFEIKRTRREGETKGSLSMKEAREAGFEID